MNLIKNAKLQYAKTWNRLGDWLLGPAATIANGTFLGELIAVPSRRTQPATQKLPGRVSINR